MGRPKAFRAVGMANRTNPVCIVVPCHRVIGSDGDLCGFGGGLKLKRQLIEHERQKISAAWRIAAKYCVTRKVACHPEPAVAGEGSGPNRMLRSAQDGIVSFVA